MTEVLRQLLPPFLWTSIKRLRDARPRYYGLDNIDQRIEKYLGHRDGFFVELGAANGINQSNTLYFERYKGWKGVLVEPTPHNYLLCRQNRASTTQVFCNACTSFDYEGEFVRVMYSNLMTTPFGLESDIVDPVAHAQSGRQHLEQHEDLFVFGALATTLNEILLKADAPRTIDLLSLDVEGAELEVLKGIDHEMFRFKLMCIECRSRDKMIAYLEPLGYQLLEQLSGRDYLFGLKAATSTPSSND